MTLTEMKAYFELLLAETTSSSDFVTSAEQTDLINEGCLVFGLETKIVRPAYQSITMVTGTAAYDLNSDFLAMAEGVFLYDANSSYQHEITPIEGGYKAVIEANSSNDSPSEYAIRGYTKAAATDAPVHKINFNPPPSASYNNYVARVYYAKIPLTLSGSTDISDIPVQFHRGPVIAAIALLKERDQEFQQSSYFWKRAKWWIDKAKREMLNWDKIPTGWRYAEGQYVER